MRENDLFDLTGVELPGRRGRVFTVSEKVSLQKLVLQYRIHSKHLSVACRKIAWARLTQEFNSNKGYSRTEVQLKKCWDNIKTRRRLVKVRAARFQSLESRTGTQSAAQDQGLDPSADPLMPVKQEAPRWSLAGDDSDSASKEFGVAEVSLGSAASRPQDSPRLADDEFRLSPPLAARTQGSKSDDNRRQMRIEELHKLKVAEHVWMLKTLRERHATAQLERERAQLERERAQLERQRALEESEKTKLEREKARFERDIAEFQREKALLDLDRAKRTNTEIIC